MRWGLPREREPAFCSGWSLGERAIQLSRWVRAQHPRAQRCPPGPLTVTSLQNSCTLGHPYPHWCLAQQGGMGHQPQLSSLPFVPRSWPHPIWVTLPEAVGGKPLTLGFWDAPFWGFDPALVSPRWASQLLWDPRAEAAQGQPEWRSLSHRLLHHPYGSSGPACPHRPAPLSTVLCPTGPSSLLTPRELSLKCPCPAHSPSRLPGSPPLSSHVRTTGSPGGPVLTSSQDPPPTLFAHRT